MVLVKNTMFKGKIFARSEVEIKQYFRTWKENVEEKGYLDPEFYADARRGQVKEVQSMGIEEIKEAREEGKNEAETNDEASGV